MRWTLAATVAVATSPVWLAGCEDTGGGPAPGDMDAELQARVERALDASLDRIQAVADTLDEALRPVPLLTPAEEGSLRRYLNAQHLGRARALGVPRPDDAAQLASLQEQGRLVRLADSTDLWVVRELDHSAPYVTPDTEALLTELSRRFQARLDSLGLPPFRIEITSALRTAETQAELRQRNPNATAGVSTHEFGTTVDLSYVAYAAPAEGVTAFDTGDVPGLAARLRRVADAVAETVVARRNREMQAILGRVLREMQQEGKVMVTLERQQPVYHITVAERQG